MSASSLQSAGSQGGTGPVRRDTRRDFLLRPLRREVPAERPGDVPGHPVAFATVAVPPAWSDVRVRLLRRATMGLTSADLDDVMAFGYQQWLNTQINYTRIDDSETESVVAARWPSVLQSGEQLFSQSAGQVQSALQEATIYRAAFSRRQLYERMVEFWSDHFNISMQKVGYLKVLDDRDVIRKHALGNFGDLVRASAHSPAMLAYLDQNQSRAGRPNQNYARELMELHTLGVDGGYTQQDVDELARVLTGWTIAGRGEFSFNPSRHDWDQKVVLGVTIPASSPSAGMAGQQEGEQMLDLLVTHPNTSRFIAAKLLRWFVTPEPTSTQVEAIAGVFRATRGDIKLTVRAVLNEGWMASAPAKFKRPFHLVVSALRATAPAVTSVAPMNTQVRTIGQPLFLFETPDGYPDTTEYWSGNLVPRWNMGTTLSTLTNTSTINLDVSAYLAGTPDGAIDRIERDFFAGELALGTRLALLQFLQAGSFDATRVRETIALALSCAEFQWY